MALQQNLNIKLSQGLTMTNDLQQAIKLLQMNALQLQDFVDNEMLDNPCLEGKDEFSEIDSDKIVDNSDDHDFDAAFDDMYEPSSSYEGSSSSDDEYNLENFVSQEETLHEHLRTQLSVVKKISQKHRFLCQYLIDGVQDTGYLEYDLVKEARRLNVSYDMLEDCLTIIQTFTPEGVGARNLKECLTLQAYNKRVLDDKLEGLLNNLHLLANKDLKSLKKNLNIDAEELAKYTKLLTSFTPKPGLIFGSSRGSEVVPDVMVLKDENGNLKVELNNSRLPKVGLNNSFNKKSFSSKTDKKFIGEKMNRANWLLKSLTQRQETIYKTTNALLELQKNFFLFGPDGLVPLTLKQVAEKIEVHESTVSRISNEKFIQTEYGVFQFKYFFASGVAASYGKQMVGADAVKRMIKKIIDSELETKPFSDEKLVALLNDEGVDLARRTVAKYRESLNIPSSSKRKVKN